MGDDPDDTWDDPAVRARPAAPTQPAASTQPSGPRDGWDPWDARRLDALDSGSARVPRHLTTRRPPRVPVEWDEPFARLARTHALSLGGDTLVAITLASSLFFTVDPSAARWRILLYLVLTVAPFAIVGPLIGPAMDRVRGGHRAVLIASNACRAVLALLMTLSVGGGSLWLFPEAFGLLVAAKTYQVAKAALVPGVVPSETDLVQANSKLQLLAGLAGFAAGIPGGLLSLAGPGFVIAAAALVFGAATAAAFGVPATVVASEPASAAEAAELASAPVVLAATSMSLLRAAVGLVTFLLAFALRSPPPRRPVGHLVGEVVGRLGSALGARPVPLTVTTPPKWYFGVVVGLSVLGAMVGASLAPRLRTLVTEEDMMTGSLGAVVVAGLACGFWAGLGGMAVLSFGVAVASTAGKQAFDALVQRDAPDANRGRMFARFESRFQMVWVAGALLPVAVRLPVRVGGVLVALAAVLAIVVYRTEGGAPRVGRELRTRLQHLPLPERGARSSGSSG